VEIIWKKFGTFVGFHEGFEVVTGCSGKSESD
jgi:hypothetical protein